MIDKLILRNIEIHKNSMLIFTPGVNFITGSSDNGKSSVAKALNWIIKNRPSGTVLVRRGQTEARALAQIGKKRVSREARVVKKSRTLKLNQYQVNRDVFKAVSREVPEEVATVMDMNEVNVQGQFETFFLLQDNPGQVAKKFNTIMGLDVIDTSLKKSTKIVNQANAAIKAAEQTVEDCKYDLSQFEDLEAVEKSVARAEQKTKKIQALYEKIKSAEKLFEQYQDVKDQYDDIIFILGAEEKANQAQNLLTKINKQRQNIGNAQKQIKNLSRIETTINDQDHFLGSEKKALSVKKKIDIQNKIRRKTGEVSVLFRQLNTKERTIKKAEGRLTGAKKDLYNLKQQNPKCPTCGGDWL